jgi:sugar phosphate isomerase/epimerase
MPVIAAQFYTLRDDTGTREGFQRALEKVAEIGYEGVQLSAVGCMNGPEPAVDANEARKMLDACGLKCVATHRGLNSLLQDTDREIEFHQALGCDYVAIGWLDESYGRFTDGYRRFMAEAQPMAARLASSGIRFGYHNHDHEFVRDPATGRTPYISLLNEAPWLQLEIDTYWVAHAGVDPGALLERARGRIAAVHLKDKEVVLGEGPVMAPVGEGNLDWFRIFEACFTGGTEYLIVEQDVCRRDPYDCLRSSYRFVREALNRES